MHVQRRHRRSRGQLREITSEDIAKPASELYGNDFEEFKAGKKLKTSRGDPIDYVLAYTLPEYVRHLTFPLWLRSLDGSGGQPS